MPSFLFHSFLFSGSKCTSVYKIFLHLIWRSSLLSYRFDREPFSKLGETSNQKQEIRISLCVLMISLPLMKAKPFKNRA